MFIHKKEVKVKELIEWLQKQSNKETIVGFIQYAGDRQKELAKEVCSNCKMGILIKERINDPNSQFKL